MSLHIYVCEANQVKIIGGSETSTDTFPWMVSIGIGYPNAPRHLCGGTIVSDIFVLTAANCVAALTLFPSLLSIRAGIQNIYNISAGNEQFQSVSQILLNPNYDSVKFLNNIALVRVSSPFNTTTLSVSTILLSNLTLLENMNLTTIGWGLTTNQTNASVAPMFLQKITVQEIIECTENSSDPQTQLCAPGRICTKCFSVKFLLFNVFFFLRYLSRCVCYE